MSRGGSLTCQCTRRPGGGQQKEHTLTLLNQGKALKEYKVAVMRGMSGPELVSRLSVLHPALRFVFMSGYTGELNSEHEVGDRGIPLLEKPFTRASLLRTPDNALD